MFSNFSLIRCSKIFIPTKTSFLKQNFSFFPFKKFYSKNIFSTKSSELKFRVPFSSKNMSVNERKFHFTEEESYMLNEHDRMLVQLDSNSIPLTTLPKFMKELTEYCFYLSKYKHYIKGWSYVIKFFSQNLKNFTNEDLDFYIDIFASTNYLGDNNFWNNLVEECSGRTLDKSRVIYLLNSLVHINFVNVEYITKIVRKLEEFNLTFNEYIQVGTFLGILYKNKQDPIWETILTNIEQNKIILTALDDKTPPTYILRLANYLKKNSNRESHFYNTAIEFYDNNFDSINPEYLPIITSEYIELTQPGTNELIRLIVQTSKKLGNSSEYAKFSFYENVLRFCAKNLELISGLDKFKDSLPTFFVIPSQKLVSDFVEFEQKYLSFGDRLTDNAIESCQSFWTKYSDKIGFNASFASDSYVNQYFNYSTIEEFSKRIKKE